MNWDDLRIIAAVRNEGTYASAGAQLRIDETTVSRRLARIERMLGVTLFEPVDGIRRPTAACEAIAAHVETIERQVAAICAVKNRANEPAGNFRIASTNTVAETVLAPRLTQLLTANPGLTIQLLTANENVNFSRWEADLAVRLHKPERGDFSIVKLADIRLVMLEPTTPNLKGSAPIVCCYPDDLDRTPESQFLASKDLLGAARCVTDNIRVVRTLVESHRTIGILPEYLCGGLSKDKQLKRTLLPRRREAWLLVQPHLIGNRAARIVIDWIRSAFTDLRRPQS